MKCETIQRSKSEQRQSMVCSPNRGDAQMDHQPFPQKGRLAKNMDFPLTKLRAKIGSEHAEVYCYVVETVKCRNCSVRQKGSAPNFQGGLITLCTCKHLMRTSLDPDKWKGKWIAGFSGVEAGKGCNALFYLMKIQHALKSHQRLWFCEDIPEETKVAKSAHRNRFGDVYEPKNKKSQASNEFAIRTYLCLHPDHSHNNCCAMHKDTDYKGYKDRRPALLVGDPKHSFLWQQPTIFCKFQLPRNSKKLKISKLIEHLRGDR